ncbi:apolipoprotein N-acyltransferase [Thalassotalea euphylliae]|uniref:apolipoprotein N-acyltransferase n=1 Tax=Thalassotalea euphylliae TaxID=1655234 RepID=UPI0036337F0D
MSALISRLKALLTTPANIVSFLAGALLVFAYAPYSLWWLTPLLLATWVKSIDGKSIKQATVASYCFGLGWFGTGISWVHVSIDQFGGMPLPASLFLMALLCAYLALFPALAGYIASRFSTGKKLNIWLLPSIWIFTEWLRGWFLTGFPWLSVGYSQIDSPLSGFAPVVGEVGLTLILLVIAVCVVKLVSKQSIVLHSMALLSIAAVTFWLNSTAFTSPTGEIKKVALAQGNIAQELKWKPEQEWPTMVKYMDLTRQHYNADLIVWPESAIPTVEPMAKEYLDMANSAAAMNSTAIVTGIINYNFESREYFNSLVVLGKQNKEDTDGSYYYPNENRFYKHHLLPIGEFVPFQELLRPIAPFFNLPMSSFTRGDYVQPNLMANGIQLAPLICFEIAFPEQLHANFSESTDILLTVSNDAWFGTSHGPHQHMEIARMRAREFGRPLIRSTNTGVTAAVDEQGKFTGRIPQFEEAVLSVDVALVSGQTPFSRYQKYPTFIFSAFLFIILLLVSRRQINRLYQ